MNHREQRRNNIITYAERIENGIPATLNFRALVLGKSVALEHLTSLLISERLNIDMNNSEMFGSSPYALTFSERIRLLSAMMMAEPSASGPRRAIDQDVKTRLEIIGEVRNRVAHDAQLTTILNAIQPHRLQWMMEHYGNAANSQDPVKVEDAFTKMADAAIKSVKDVLGTDRTHVETQAQQNAITAKFYALSEGLNVAVQKITLELRRNNTVGFQWTKSAIAEIPMLTYASAIKEAEEILKAAGR